MRATGGNAVQVRSPAIRALEVKTQQEPHDDIRKSIALMNESTCHLFHIG